MAADGELRRDRRHDRAARSRSWPSSSTGSTGIPGSGVCLDSCHLYASGYDVTDAGALDAVLDELDREIGLDRLRALHVNDSAAPLGSNRDRHANIEDGPARARSSRCSSGNPRLQGLPAVLEVAGPDGHGPNADEIAKAKKLHRAGVRAAEAAHERGAQKPSPRPEPVPPRGPAAGLPPFSAYPEMRACLSRIRAEDRANEKAPSGARLNLREDPEARLADGQLAELRVRRTRGRPRAPRNRTRPRPGTSAAAAGSPAPRRTPRAARPPASARDRSRRRRPSACTRRTSARPPRTSRGTGNRARRMQTGRRSCRSGLRSGGTRPRPEDGEGGLAERRPDRRIVGHC